MQLVQNVGLVKALLVVAALIAANLYVGARENPLEAQGGVALPESICVNQGLELGAFCDHYPLNDCVWEACVSTALEP